MPDGEHPEQLLEGGEGHRPALRDAFREEDVGGGEPRQYVVAPYKPPVSGCARAGDGVLNQLPHGDVCCQVVVHVPHHGEG